MNSFDSKKNVEDSIKHGLITTAADTGIFFAITTENVKPPQTSLDDMDNIKPSGGICERVFMKDYAIYNKWINE